MLKFKSFLVLLVVLSTMIFTSCQNEPNPVESQELHNSTQPPSLSKFSIPIGATFESATLYIYVNKLNNHDINLHRITSPWEEMEVTWNNFGSSYAPEVEGSFNAATVGWYSVDITTLVGSWLEGTNPNYGLLLDQVIENPPPAGYQLARYNSTENSENHPYLEICYTNGGLVCEEIEAFQDSWIKESAPNQPFGGAFTLYTGWDDTALEHQTLIIFDIEPTIGGGCTRTPIYWKRHTQFGPKPRNPIWDLILPSGETSEFFLSGKNYYRVLKKNPFGNSYYSLGRQYIAAKLNMLNGASIPAEVQAVFDSATTLFNTYTPRQVKGWRFFHPIRKQFRSYAFLLFKYNWGIIGPGRCGN